MLVKVRRPKTFFGAVEGKHLAGNVGSHVGVHHVVHGPWPTVVDVLRQVEYLTGFQDAQLGFGLVDVRTALRPATASWASSV